MKARFFYAASCHNTWPKLYVLTQDGKLYSKYLDFMQPAEDVEQVNFESFLASDYLFGGYQSLEEITLEVALGKSLRSQSNWIQRYLDSLPQIEIQTLEPKTDKIEIMENEVKSQARFILLNTHMINLYKVVNAQLNRFHSQYKMVIRVKNEIGTMGTTEIIYVTKEEGQNDLVRLTNGINTLNA